MMDEKVRGRRAGSEPATAADAAGRGRERRHRNTGAAHGRPQRPPHRDVTLTLQPDDIRQRGMIQLAIIGCRDPALNAVLRLSPAELEDYDGIRELVHLLHDYALAPMSPEEWREIVKELRYRARHWLWRVERESRGPVRPVLELP